MLTLRIVSIRKRYEFPVDVTWGLNSETVWHSIIQTLWSHSNCCLCPFMDTLNTGAASYWNSPFVLLQGQWRQRDCFTIDFCGLFLEGHTSAASGRAPSSENKKAINKFTPDVLGVCYFFNILTAYGLIQCSCSQTHTILTRFCWHSQ